MDWNQLAEGNTSSLYIVPTSQPVPGATGLLHVRQGINHYLINGRKTIDKLILNSPRFVLPAG
jgi:hypothetical protein